MDLLPHEEYARRLGLHEVRAAQYERLHERLSTWRLLVFAVTAFCGWATWEGMFSTGWLLLPCTGFVGLLTWHARVRGVRAKTQRAAGFYRRGIARIEDRWSGQGATGQRFDDLHHVYASDLDLFGHGSLFQLLSIARTRMGEERLAQWLLAPAPAAEILERQACIAELRDKLDLREDLALLGTDAEVSVQPKALMTWAQAKNSLTQRWLPWAAFVLPALLAIAVLVWNRWGIASPVVALLLIEIGLLRWVAKPLHAVLYGTESAFENLRLLAAILTRLEREPVNSSQLRALLQSLVSHDLPASRAIGRLATIVHWIESRRNPLLALLQVPLLYPLHTALAAQRWRVAHGRTVAAWLDTIGEIEALNSLAAYSFEHPADCLPQFVDGKATFVAQELGHPLIAATRCVRNDVSVAEPVRVLLISGSNMSGKSTLLRTVGINTVLAMMGAPVRARSLALTPLQVGASIRINDSLHEGSSRFYAEIQRLRQLNDLVVHAGPAGKLPLLFLLDEMLQGTNSHDRRIGAEGIVHAFLEQGAIGLISTHDLALTDLDGQSSRRLHNMHFQDELLEGKLQFDFILREGIVTRSNGVELMRSIGLNV